MTSPSPSKAHPHRMKMYQGLFTGRELAAAAVLIAVAGYAALALGHGKYQTAVIVEVAMVGGFVNVLRARELERTGRTPRFGQNWLAVGWFALAVVVLLLAPTL